MRSMIAAKKIAKHRARRNEIERLVQIFESKVVSQTPPPKQVKYASLMLSNIIVNKKLKPIRKTVEKKTVKVQECQYISVMKGMSERIKLRLLFAKKRVQWINVTKTHSFACYVPPAPRLVCIETNPGEAMSKLYYQTTISDGVVACMMKLVPDFTGMQGLGDKIKEASEALVKESQRAGESVERAVDSSNIFLREFQETINRATDKITTEGVPLRFPDKVVHEVNVGGAFAKFLAPVANVLAPTALWTKIITWCPGLADFIALLTNHGLNEQARDCFYVIMIGLINYLLSKYEFTGHWKLAMYGLQAGIAWYSDSSVVIALVAGILGIEVLSFVNQLVNDQGVVACANIPAPEMSRVFPSVLMSFLATVAIGVPALGLEQFMKSVTTFQKLKNGLEFTFEKLIECVYEIFGNLGDSMGLSMFRNAYSKYPVLYEVSDRMRVLEDKIGYSEPIKTREVDEFKDIRKLLDAVDRKIPLNQESTVYRRQVATLLARAKVLETSFRCVGAFGAMMRLRSKMITLVGPSEIGKTLLSPIIMNGIVPLLLDDDERDQFERNPNDFVGSWSTKEFKDEWRNGTVAYKWDDWGQTKKAADPEKCDGRMLIAVQNNERLFVNKSAVTDKNTTLMEALLGIITTNVTHLDAGNLHVIDVNAVANRLNDAWKVHILPEYVIGDTDGFDYSVDWTKVVKGELNTKIYGFQRYTFKHDIPVAQKRAEGPIYPFEEFMNIIAGDTLSHVEKEEAHLRLLQTAATNRALNPLYGKSRETLLHEHNCRDPKFWLNELPSADVPVDTPGPAVARMNNLFAPSDNHAGPVSRVSLNASQDYTNSQTFKNDEWNTTVTNYAALGVASSNPNNMIWYINFFDQIRWLQTYSDDQEWLNASLQRHRELVNWYRGTEGLLPLGAASVPTMPGANAFMHNLFSPTSLPSDAKKVFYFFKNLYRKCCGVVRRTGLTMSETLDLFLNLPPDQAATCSVETIIAQIKVEVSEAKQTLLETWVTHTSFLSIWARQFLQHLPAILASCVVVEKVVANSGYAKFRVNRAKSNPARVVKIEPQVVVVDGVASVGTAGVLSSGLHQKMDALFFKNAYGLYAHGQWVVNAVGYYDRKLLVNDHARAALQLEADRDPAFKFELISAKTGKSTEIIWRYVKWVSSPDVDQCLMCLSHFSSFDQVSDIRDFFIPENVPIVTGTNTMLHLLREKRASPLSQPHIEQHWISCPVLIGDTIYDKPGGGEYHIKNALVIGVAGKYGDCMSLLWLADSRMPGKDYICGAFTASKKDGQKVAFCSRLTRESLANMDRAFEPVPSLSVPTVPITGVYACAGIPDCTPIVDVRKPTSAPMKTVLTPTRFQEREIFGPPKKMPSEHRPFTTVEDGVRSELIEPQKLAFTGYTPSVKAVNPPLFSLAVDMYKSTYIRAVRQTHPTAPVVLSLDESVLGVGLNEGISRSTGVGYSYKARGISKLDLFGAGVDKDLTTSAYLAYKEEVYSCIALMSARKVVNFIYDGFLKPDEALDIEKVLKGKARPLLGACVVKLGIGKMYYGDELEAVNMSPISCGLAGGLNPYCSDWHSLGKILERYKLIAGDYKAWDKTFMDAEHAACADLDRAYYYNGTEEEHNVRDCYTQDTSGSLAALHTGENDVIVKIDCSQKSGDLKTLKDNGQGNNIRIRYMILSEWIELNLHIDPDDWDPRLHEIPPTILIEANIFVICQGDDHVIGVNEVTSWFTQGAMQRQCKKRNFIYTDENKGTMDLPDHRELSQISFTKRIWLWNAFLNRYVAPLNIESIINSLYWTADRECSMMQVVNGALLEFSLWGTHIWDLYAVPLIKETIEVLGEVPRFTNYEAAIAFSAGIRSARLSGVLASMALMHDIETNPGEEKLYLEGDLVNAVYLLFYEYGEIKHKVLQSHIRFYQAELERRSVRQKAKNKEEYLKSCTCAVCLLRWTDPFEEYSQEELMPYIVSLVNDLAKEGFFECGAWGWLVEIMLMHDIELNPGEVVSLVRRFKRWVGSLFKLKPTKWIANMEKVFINDSSLEGFGLSSPCIEYAEFPSLDTDQNDNCVACMNSASTTSNAGGTTEFIDEGPVATFEVAATTDLDEYDRSATSIKDFLAKPYLIDNFLWNVSDSAGVTLSSIAGVGQWLTIITQYANKIQGYNLVRGTAVLKVQINPNRFHQGALIVNFLPDMPGLQNLTIMANLISVTQTPHVVLDCRDSAVEMKLPFVSPAMYYDIKNANYDWGKFYVSVFSPLLTDGTNSQEIQVACWLSFEDIELAAPSVPQAKFSAKTVDDEKEAMTTGSLSSGLRMVASAASTLSAIPMLSAYTGPVAWMSERLATTAAAFGYSKPSIMPAPVSNALSFWRHSANADGANLAHPLALRIDNELPRIPTISIRDEDEMSWNFLKNVEFLFTTFDWQHAHDIDHNYNIFSAGICPSILYNQGTVTKGAHVMTYRVGGPIFYLNQLFTFWRGAFSVRFKFRKTEFHTGRLLFEWTPSFLTTGVGQPTVTSGILALREIVDLKLTDELTLDLPYLVPYNYLDMNQPSGYLRVTVLTPLMAPETCSQSVFVQVFVKGAPDFEFAAPVGTGSISGPCFAAMQPIKTVVGNQKKLSMKTNHAAECQGEVFSSVKQLLNRMCVIAQSSATTLANAGGFAVWPWFVSVVANSTGGAVAPKYGGDMYSIIAPMYHLYRGGMTVGACARSYTASTDSHHYISSLVPTTVFASSVTPITAGLGVPQGNSWVSGYNYFAPTARALTGFHVSDDSVNSGMWSVPYHNSMRCSKVYWDSGGTMATAAPFQDCPITMLNVTGSGGEPQTSFFRQVKDDFQFGYFVACPPLYVSIT